MIRIASEIIQSGVGAVFCSGVVEAVVQQVFQNHDLVAIPGVQVVSSVGVSLSFPPVVFMIGRMVFSYSLSVLE